MHYGSVNGKSPAVGFRDALFQGMAPDGGLYVPEQIPHLPTPFLESLPSQSLHAIGRRIISLFAGEIPDHDLSRLIERAWTFPIPLVKLEENLFLLELYHGPTLAFKDVGARFMAQALSYFLEKEQRHITIVVATSGDTGSAVAHGFYNVPHVDVFVLYPSGRISKLQEQQMTTLGGNIHALEVEGTFDDCQHLVKQALADREVVEARNLTTANSINVGRLIPQIVYYVWALAQLRGAHGIQTPPTVVVPSGNFGNLTAVAYARSMGTPIDGFIAATNANDVVPEYLASGTFTPRPSVQTYSNAMDVGNPSNLARLQFLYKNHVETMRRDIQAESVTDEETLDEIRVTYERTGTVLDPHTAVGVRAARRMYGLIFPRPVIVAATAHPGKFPEVVQRALGRQIPLPAALTEGMRKQKQSLFIKPDYREVKALLLSPSSLS
jgi:threonine synthase